MTFALVGLILVFGAMAFSCLRDKRKNKNKTEQFCEGVTKLSLVIGLKPATCLQVFCFVKQRTRGLKKPVSPEDPVKKDESFLNFCLDIRRKMAYHVCILLDKETLKNMEKFACYWCEEPAVEFKNSICQSCLDEVAFQVSRKDTIVDPYGCDLHLSDVDFADYEVQSAGRRGWAPKNRRK